MCDPVSIVALGGMLGGKAMGFYGKKQAGDATEKVWREEQANQKRLQEDSLKTASAAASENAPAQATAAQIADQTAGIASSAADAHSLAAAVGGTGADSSRFAGDVQRGAATSASQVDASARNAAILRAFGLVGQNDELAKARAGFRIGANRLQGEDAMARMPTRLAAAGAQGRGWRLAGTVFDRFGSGILSSGLGGVGNMVPSLHPAAGTAGTMGGPAQVKH